MEYSNPFDVINKRLDTIERGITGIYAILNQHPIKDEDDDVEIEEAAKLCKLSVDRLYAIHKNILFNTRKPGKKLIFSRKEVLSYIAKHKLRTINYEVQDALAFTEDVIRKKIS